MSELRAATRLVRVTGGPRREQARDMLRDAYGRFTEGLDYPDLQAARTQIEAEPA